MELTSEMIIEGLKHVDCCVDEYCEDMLCDDCIGEQLLEYNFKIMGLGLYKFIEDLEAAARANWCPAQVDMLERLVGSIIDNVPYDEWQRNEN